MEVEIKSREEKYRGRQLAALKEMDIREVAKLMPSRSRRTILRHFDIIERFVKECEKKEQTKKPIRTHLRDLIVVPRLVGKSIGIHSGKEYQIVQITVDMIGHRLGEFALTRKKVNHSEAGIGATKGSRALKK